uniref:Uncharacterized protein n=1 Tax=Anguilla anguilla TaxID=7936 RepID=A0A0E9WRU4_ANGAN
MTCIPLQKENSYRLTDHRNVYFTFTFQMSKVLIESRTTLVPHWLRHYPLTFPRHASVVISFPFFFHYFFLFLHFI